MRFVEWILTRIVYVVMWLLAMLLTAGPALTQTPTAPNSSTDETSTIDSLARTFKADADLPGLIIGIVDGSATRVLPYGVASLSDSTRLRADTRFEIGSVTKTFTGLLLADMAERGEVDLSDPIGSYLPDSVDTPDADGQPIELRHLAIHTSGLPHLPSNFAPGSGPTANSTSG